MSAHRFVYVPEYGYSVTERETVWHGDGFTAQIHLTRLETGEEMAFFHLTVPDMTPAVLKAMLRRWQAHRHTLPDPLFTCADADSPSLDRLRKRFGFRHILTLPCTDGKERKLFVCRAK